MSTTLTETATASRPAGQSSFRATGGPRSEHAARTDDGVVILVFRRQAPRGWLWEAQDKAGRHARGRAPTRCRAQQDALAAARRIAGRHSDDRGPRR